MGLSTDLAGTLKFAVVLNFNTENFVEWPVKDTYNVRIRVYVDGAEPLSMTQLSASKGMEEKLRQHAKRLVATTTGTKPSQWNAHIGDFIVVVTRKAGKK